MFIINTVNDDLPDEIETPDVEYPGDDPTKEPSDDYEWRGKPPKEGKKVHMLINLGVILGILIWIMNSLLDLIGIIMTDLVTNGECFLMEQ